MLIYIAVNKELPSPVGSYPLCWFVFMLFSFSIAVSCSADLLVFRHAVFLQPCCFKLSEIVVKCCVALALACSVPSAFIAVTFHGAAKLLSLLCWSIEPSCRHVRCGEGKGGEEKREKEREGEGEGRREKEKERGGGRKRKRG